MNNLGSSRPTEENENISPADLPDPLMDEPIEVSAEQCRANQDNMAVAKFASVMMDKMAKSRAKGRSGWQTCSVEDLWTMLREHIEKGDPVDVACFAMMIYSNELDQTIDPPSYFG